MEWAYRAAFADNPRVPLFRRRADIGVRILGEKLSNGARFALLRFAKGSKLRSVGKCFAPFGGF